jgi:beta-lactamase regulating signal transducer with metallopeptidase domain
MTVLSLLIEGALKATLLFGAAGLVAFALRGATASLRHLIWSCSLVGMLAVPALSLVVPRWQLGIIAAPGEAAVRPPLDLTPSKLPVLDRTVTTADPIDVAEAAVGVSTPASSSAADHSSTRDWTTSLVLLWLGGVAAGLITIAGGLLTLRRIARRSRTLVDPEWTQLALEISRDLGIARPVRLMIAESAAMPATWGIIRPTVLLPADAESWNEERRRVVLLHELAHVRRKDSLMQVVAQFCCAVYWFHPGVWYTAGKLRSERELACDEHVLGAGMNACDYAAHLLEIATRLRAPANTSLAVAMARRSQLEGRLVAILTDNSSARFKATPRTRAATVAALVTLTLPLAAMRPWKTLVTEPAPEAMRHALVTEPSPKVEPPVTMAAPTDTFRWKGIVPPGKWVEVLADYSDIQIELSRSNQVEILAIRKTGAPGSYRIAMENTSSGPHFCLVSATANESKPCERTGSGELKNGLSGTRVDFLVKLPAGVGASVHTSRGNIAAEGVQSYVWGTSGQGDISIVTTDLAEASTTVGSISAQFGRRSWRQDLEFFTDRGDVTVVAPTDANMMVQVETGLGKATSEFGGKPTSFGVGERIMSRIGSRIGSRGGMLTLRSGRGNVELKRGSRAVAEASSMRVDETMVVDIADAVTHLDTITRIVEVDAPLSSVDPKPNPNPKPDYNANPDLGYDPNPNPAYDPDENPIPEIDAAQANARGVTGELVPVSIPKDLVSRFSNATIRGWPDARAIARLRDIAATHVKKHPNDYVRERSEWALTLVKNGEIVSPLRAALSSSDWRIRAYAAWALGETQDPRGRDALTAALADAHWRVRMHAAAGLERIGGAQTVPPLIVALSDRYWQVRAAAVDALAAIGDRRAVSRLQTMAARDPHSAVRYEAQAALERLR